MALTRADSALQSSSPEDLIVLDRNYRDRMDLRRNVIATHPATVMGVVPSADGGGPSDQPSPQAKAAVDELYAYLMGTYLPARYPTVFVVQPQPRAGDEKEKASAAQLHNRMTGATFPCDPPADPLEAFRILGETVEDDFFLLQEEEAGTTPTAYPPTAYPPTSHRLVAFLCCFPSGFDPSAKLGHLLRDIHAPVPAYDKIGPSMERFFSRLQVGRNVKRLNVRGWAFSADKMGNKIRKLNKTFQWSIQTHGELFYPRGNHIVDGDVFTEDEEADIANVRHKQQKAQKAQKIPKRSRPPPQANKNRLACASSARRSRDFPRPASSSLPSRRTSFPSPRSRPRASAPAWPTPSRVSSRATRPACGCTRALCAGAAACVSIYGHD